VIKFCSMAHIKTRTTFFEATSSGTSSNSTRALGCSGAVVVVLCEAASRRARRW
jgi:hypothetical protein